MPLVVVDVMPKPEILDPQGKAVTQSLGRLGHHGFTVRQGKRFEVTVAGELTNAVLAEIDWCAKSLLCNPVIETYQVHALDQEA